MMLVGAASANTLDAPATALNQRRRARSYFVTRNPHSETKGKRAELLSQLNRAEPCHC
jgi:hypothetical protein